MTFWETFNLAHFGNFGVAMVTCYERLKKTMMMRTKLVSVIQLRVARPNPQHIGIFMDANRYWAKQFGLPAALGHTSGAKRLRSIVQACANR